MNGSSVGARELWPSAATKQQEEPVAGGDMAHLSKWKKFTVPGTEEKERVIETEAGKEGGMRPERALLDPG